MRSVTVMKRRAVLVATTASVLPLRGWAQEGKKIARIGFLPALKDRIDDGYRAGIETSLYDFQTDETGSQEGTVVGSGKSATAPARTNTPNTTPEPLPKLCSTD